MTHKEFEQILLEAQKRRTEVLIHKGTEYGPVDRLQNFKQGAALRGANTADCVFWFLTKHLQSISEMCKTPHKHSQCKWYEKLDDARNYLDLLEAALTEMMWGQSKVQAFEIGTEGMREVPSGYARPNRG